MMTGSQVLLQLQQSPTEDGCKLGGVHGIALLVKKSIYRHVTVLENLASHCVLWVIVNVRAFNKAFALGIVYIPHENSRYFHQTIHDDILQDITEITMKYDVPIILMGDFNARTGKATDMVTIDESVILATDTDADLFDSFDSKDKAELLGIDLARHSQDKVTNGNGFQLLQCCKMADLKIINGRFGQDAGIGAFTCSNANGSSVVDYAVASTSLLPNVSNFRVDAHDKCLSDIHCSISLSLSITNSEVPSNGVTL